MSNRKELEVTCPITGVKHLIIHSNEEENVRALRKWATSLYIRMERNHKIIFSLDCEGWKLGTIKNSLGLLQICEFLDESILEYDYLPQHITSVGIRPGFLIHFPASNDVIDLLSGVLSHKNAVICTFDFTSDIASLQEQGVNVNMNSLFDAQLINQCYNPIKHTSVTSIIKAANSLTNPIKEARKAVSFMENKKNNSMFEILTFLYKDDKEPFQAMIDKDFYKYAAGDLVMTGLAVLYCYEIGVNRITEEMTRLKVREFQQYQNTYGNLLMPSAVRQAAFIDRYSLVPLQELQKKLDTNQSSITVESDFDIRNMLNMYTNADKICYIQGSLPQDERSIFNTINAESIRKSISKILEKKIDRIRELNPLNEDSYSNQDQ